jgi:ribosomal-protein-alanine N-acetyltransferase
MSALPEQIFSFRPMQKSDVDTIMPLERVLYSFPWTPGNFTDSLNAGYSCWVYEFGSIMVGYAVLMLGAGEAHVLNIAIAQDWQRQGLGRRLLQHLIKVAREYHAEMMFLEVRPSNIGALRLYEDIGFNEIAKRRGYYPAHDGREDAILMGLAL